MTSAASGPVVFFGEQLAPPDVRRDIVRRDARWPGGNRRWPAGTVRSSCSALPEADAESAAVDLRTRCDDAFERARPLSALAEIQLEPSELERGVAPGRSRRGRGQKFFRFCIAAVIDVDAGAERDRAEGRSSSENPCDLVVLSEVESFARGVKRARRRQSRLRAQQRAATARKRGRTR